MKVLFDHQIFYLQSYGGAWNYFYHLMDKFERQESVDFEIALKYTNNAFLLDKYNFSSASKKNVKNPLIKGIYNQYYKAKNKQVSLKNIDYSTYDLLHATYYDPYFLKTIKKPFVVTVHDMIHEKFPMYFNNWKFIAESKKLLCQKATRIIAVSHCTKRDLIDLLDIPSEKIDVIHHGGLEVAEDKGPSSNISLPKKYIFYVGSRKGYKNFNRFFKAITPLMQTDEELHLICTGEQFSKDEIAQFTKLGLAGRVHQYFLDYNDFPFFYKHALAFVFPSLYEGFGIPVLEAFSAKCPAILSNTSSLPEVGGEAAEYFDPKSEQSIKESIESVIYNQEKRKAMIEKGLTQLQNFSWTKAAKETLNCYEECIGESVQLN